MIGKFLSSRFSGYLAIGGIVLVLGLVWYIYAEGKRACENSIKSDQLADVIKVQDDAREVRRIEQQLKTPQLDRALCGLGIVRGDAGCE